MHKCGTTVVRFMEAADLGGSSDNARIYVSVAVMLIILGSAAIYLVTIPQPTQMSSTAATTSKTTTRSTSTSSSSSGVPSLPTDWLTYHYNNQRTGFMPSPVTFSVPSVRWIFSVDRAVYAEPLAYRGSVFVVTENNSVYSISLSGGVQDWRTNLGSPLPRSALSCGNIDPVGITGTPAIDPSTSTLYVVAMLNGQGYRLFALSTDDGSIRWSTPLNPQGFDYHVEQQRGAMAISNGFVYVPFGGFAGDCGNYHGWVVAYPTNGTGNLVSFQVPSTREAGIWAPGGIVISANGSLLVATGNSDSSSSFDYGNAVLRLNSDLAIMDHFAPSNWVSLNAGDTDLGSIPPLELGNGMIFQAGKEGVGYLLNESDLGKIGGQLYSSRFCNEALGAAALAPTLIPHPIIPCKDGLYQLSVSGSGEPPAFGVAWSQKGFYAGPPIIAYGAVWSVNINNGTLFAFDQADGRTLFRMSLGPVTHFTTPSAGEGSILVVATDKVYSFLVSS